MRVRGDSKERRVTSAYQVGGPLREVAGITSLLTERDVWILTFFKRGLDWFTGASDIPHSLWEPCSTRGTSGRSSTTKRLRGRPVGAFAGTTARSTVFGKCQSSQGSPRRTGKASPRSPFFLIIGWIFLISEFSICSDCSCKIKNRNKSNLGSRKINRLFLCDDFLRRFLDPISFKNYKNMWILIDLDFNQVKT